MRHIVRMGSVARLKLTRRDALWGTAAIVCGALLTIVTKSVGRAQAEPAARTSKVCKLTPEAVEGPFYFDPRLERSDITEGKEGAPLKVAFQVVEADSCAAHKDARVDIWHSDAHGLYSGYPSQITGSAVGETFLRGHQKTDAEGVARFDTIYPGWYPGRTPHIHFKVFLGTSHMVTGQLYFPDPVTETVYAARHPYITRKEERDTFNSTDYIFQRQGGADTLGDVTEEGGRYHTALIIGIVSGGRIRTELGR
jgi:protocatechuate 3,4-dioxygenase beta subunit